MNSDNCTVNNSQKKRHHRETHGMHGTETYTSWQSMKKRCYNKNDLNYSNYGGRGVSVCKEWKISFVNFLSDMGVRPKGTSIDRIDNDKGYSKGNCKWSNRLVQNYNRRIRSSNKTGIKGVWFNKIKGNYRASISYNNKRTNLGVYSVFLDACCARKSAENKIEQP